MKKKLWVIPVMLLAAFCLAFLPGCGGPSAEEVITSDVIEALDEVKNCDDDFIEEIEKSMNSSDDFTKLGVSSSDFAKAFLKGFTYKIKSVDVDEDAGTATVKVSIKCKSMNTIVSDFTQKFTTQALENTDKSEDELYKLGGEILMQSTKDCANHTTECSFKYAQDDDGEWEAADSVETEIESALS